MSDTPINRVASAIDRWMECPAPDPEDARRGRWLNRMIWTYAALAVALVLVDLTVPQIPLSAGLPIHILINFVLVGIYAMNRRGWVQAATVALLILITLAIFALTLVVDMGQMAALIFPVYFVLIVSTAGVFLPWRAMPAIGAIVSVIMTAYYLNNPRLGTLNYTDHFVLIFSMLILFISLTTLAWLSNRMINETVDALLTRNRELETTNELRAEAERKLQISNTALTMELTQREQLTRLLLTAQEDERRRIARDLHDGALGDLSAAIVALDVLTRRSEPVTSGDLRTVRTQVREVAGQVREIMNNLRPTILDDSGLEAALNQLAHKLEVRAGLPIQVQLAVPERLEAPVETAIFRVAQEALTNIVQHARARRIGLTLIAQAAGIELTIEDDGQGFEPDSARRQAEARGHIGLASLVERVEGVGGRVEWVSTRNEGTRLRCWFPYRAGAAGEPLPALTSTGRG